MLTNFSHSLKQNTVFLFRAKHRNCSQTFRFVKTDFNPPTKRPGFCVLAKRFNFMPKLRESPTMCLPLVLNSLMQFTSKGFSFVLILWNHSNRPWTHQAALNGMKLCIKSAKADLKERSKQLEQIWVDKDKNLRLCRMVTLTWPCVASIYKSVPGVEEDVIVENLAKKGQG